MHEFVVWMLTQHSREDGVGALARALAKNYIDAPRHRRQLNTWLKWAGGDLELRRAIKQAHKEWRALRCQP